MPVRTGWLGRKWPAPIWKPMWPFFIAGAGVFYGVTKIAEAMANTDEFRDDSRNFYRQRAVKQDEH